MKYKCIFCQSEIILDNTYIDKNVLPIFGKYMCPNHPTPVGHLVINDTIDSVCVVQGSHTAWISITNDKFFGEINIFTKGAREAYKANLIKIYNSNIITYEMIMDFIKKFKELSVFA